MAVVSKLVEEQTKCRVCNSANLIQVLELGDQEISDFVDGKERSPYAGLVAPLTLMLCDESKGGCGLLQLKHTVDRTALYSKYWYKSGMNDTMKAALEGLARKAEIVAPVSDGDLVLDIGCNDGTLLRGYTKKVTRVGFEPTKNLLENARAGTSLIINEFFNYEAFSRAFGKRRAKCVTSIAMFYSIENPNKFASDVAKLLDEKGVWIIQMAYLTSMLETNGFDNICHEHLEYYGLRSLEALVERHGLTVTDVELNDIYGGSIRAYIRPRAAKVPKSVAVHDLEQSELALGLDRPRPYEEFGRRIESNRKRVVSFIEEEVRSGKSVYVYGASTKGNVMLQYFGLDHRLIKAAAERNPDKWGKKTGSTLIPIISEEQARKEKPDYFLVLPWAFMEEFKRRERKFLERGGKFIVPLPELKVVGLKD